MKFPQDFPITRTWPPQHPERIQLYSINSPNGVKASVMLEETGLPYEPHLVRFDLKQQLSAEFRSLNPYAKIPAIIDPLGPGLNGQTAWNRRARSRYTSTAAGYHNHRRSQH